MTHTGYGLSGKGLIAWTIAFTACLLLNAGAAAAESTSLAGDRPNAGGPAEEITVHLVLLDVDDIDDKEQRFSIDAYYEISWHDARLAIDAGDESGSGVRMLSLDDIWTPALTIVNNRGLMSLLPQTASVDEDGHVTVRQRLSGPLAVNLDLKRFPFDTQRLEIDVVSYRYSPAEVVFASNSSLIAKPETFSADGWTFEALPAEFSEFRIVDQGRGTANLTFGLVAQRNSGFFVLTLALPMTLILFMAWTVHWLQPEVIPARMGMSTATVFSLIALGVSFRLSLPQIDYLTQADRFVIQATLLVLVSLGITVIATRWVTGGRQHDAERLTRYTRWAFPLIFLSIVALTLKT